MSESLTEMISNAIRDQLAVLFHAVTQLSTRVSALEEKLESKDCANKVQTIANTEAIVNSKKPKSLKPSKTSTVEPVAPLVNPSTPKQMPGPSNGQANNDKKVDEHAQKVPFVTEKDTSNVACDLDDGKWIQPQNHRKCKSLGVTRGTANPGATQLEASEIPKLIHIYYVKLGTTPEQVRAHLANITGEDTCAVEALKAKDTLYCNATYDTYLCWPPTPAGEVASQHCPPARLSDTSRFAFRRCGPAGLWMGRRPNESSFVGWTNYTPCFPLEVQKLLNKVYDDERDAQVNTYNDPNAKFEIAQRTRYMEIAGFSLSLVALVVSLVIFSYYRSLRNSRTRIHKSLFSAMVLQVLIRLTVYIDQELVRSWPADRAAGDNATLRGIDNMPYLCETSYVLLEYAVTVMFMWMFIEGLYLHNVVTANALREGISHVVYYATGWGLPVILTALWATLSALHYKGESVNTCWYGYNFLPIYWIVQGPRLGVVVINLVFLLNIMKVLITKLRSTASTELEKIRKAVRAALVLLPLLGITNLTNMIEAPLDGSVWKFALWSYSTHFLRSFQGFFIALIYCFLNGEVRQVIKKHYSNYMAMRGNNRRHRDSFLNFMSSSGDHKPARVRNKKSDEMEFAESFQPHAETNIDQATVKADKVPETI